MVFKEKYYQPEAQLLLPALILRGLGDVYQ
jgi:hypothetical protein